MISYENNPKNVQNATLPTNYTYLISIKVAQLQSSSAQDRDK